MLQEIAQNSEVSKNKKLRVVIYGNFCMDHANEIPKQVQDWFTQYGLDGQSSPEICKVADFVEDAFYGRRLVSEITPSNEELSADSIPVLVMAGEYLRFDGGAGWMDFKIDGTKTLEKIKKLCQEHKVPLVRFQFSESSNQPQFTSGVMASGEKRD